MNAGVAFAILACAGWGFAFIGPLILGAWSATAVAAGRYNAYGLWSLIALGVMRARSGPRPFDLKKWRDATLLTLAGNLLYYVLLSEALQRSGVFLPTLIIGLLPVTMSIAGRVRAGQPLTLAYGVALLLIVAGLLLANQPAHGATQASNWWIGLLLCLWWARAVDCLRRDQCRLAARPSACRRARVVFLAGRRRAAVRAGPVRQLAFTAAGHGLDGVHRGEPGAGRDHLLGRQRRLEHGENARVPGSLLGQMIVFESNT